MDDGNNKPLFPAALKNRIKKIKIPEISSYTILQNDQIVNYGKNFVFGEPQFLYFTLSDTSVWKKLNFTLQKKNIDDEKFAVTKEYDPLSLIPVGENVYKLNLNSLFS